MKVEPLQLAHKELLSSKFNELRLDISEYSFANLFLFRNVHAYELVFDDELFIKGKTYDGKSYLMPTFDIRNCDKKMLAKALESVDFLFPIPEEWLKTFDPKSFNATFSENDSDYVFSLEKLRTYPGRHLDGRRNLAHNFLEHYQAASYPISDDRKNDALKVLDKWHEHVKANEYDSCKEAIKLLSELKLQSKIYYVEKNAAAFIIFEPLNDEMIVIHFAKADLEYKGIYQYLYQDFAKGCDDKYIWCNWEQDLGIKGLRQSKEAYLPDKNIKKMRVKII